MKWQDSDKCLVVFKIYQTRHLVSSLNCSHNYTRVIKLQKKHYSPGVCSEFSASQLIAPNICKQYLHFMNQTSDVDHVFVATRKCCCYVACDNRKANRTSYEFNNCMEETLVKRQDSDKCLVVFKRYQTRHLVSSLNCN